MFSLFDGFNQHLFGPRKVNKGALIRKPRRPERSVSVLSTRKFRGFPGISG